MKARGLTVVCLALLLCGVVFLTACAAVDDGAATEPDDTVVEPGPDAAAAIERAGLETDTSIASVDLDLLLGGGPAKDGIPALTDPLMETVQDADADQLDDTRGIFVDFDGDRRFYPFSILVWHEIVNDTVGGSPIAVTF